MIAFRAVATTKFDKNNLSHVAELKKLWKAAFGDAPLSDSLVSHDWYLISHFIRFRLTERKKIGFQSDDPMRDFRGIGIFGVENILYMAEKYPKAFNVFMKSEAATDYPFVITAFNVTFVISLYPCFSDL